MTITQAVANLATVYALLRWASRLANCSPVWRWMSRNRRSTEAIRSRERVLVEAERPVPLHSRPIAPP